MVCECVDEWLKTEDGQAYHAFGLRYQGIFIRDLSLERGRVEELAARLERGLPSPIHLPDIIEDWLQE